MLTPDHTDTAPI